MKSGEMHANGGFVDDSFHAEGRLDFEEQLELRGHCCCI